MELTEFQAQQLLRAADDVAGSLAGSKIGLAKLPVDINPDTVLADFTAAKATFTSYVKTALVWNDPSVADDGTVEVTAIPITFRPTDAVGGPQVITSAWIEDASAAVLQFAGVFDQPNPPMNGPLDELTVMVRYRVATKSLIVVIS